jgi:outer membrane protein insertion porin family
MVEKIKKGPRNHCVTALLLLLLNGITHTQEAPNSTIPQDAQEEIVPDDLSSEVLMKEEVYSDASERAQLEDENDTPLPAKSRRVSGIVISGNKFTSDNAIINHIPYKIGETFDPRKTRTLIHNLYYGLKKFRTIKVMGEPVGDNGITIHVIVEEKLPLAEIKTSGNKHVSDKEINKKINTEEITAIDAEELKILANKIKEIYLEKGYHQTEIATELTVNEDNYATAQFTIEEGAAATVKQIHFTGNDNISGKELRAVALTKEDWLLSFLDKSGNYHPDRLEGDKHFIEQYYQNHGFLHAKVINVIVDLDEKTQNIILTFEIEEGDRYTINKISAPGNYLAPESFLLSRLPIRPGMYYSRDGMTNAIKRLELIWGDYGYIFAHVEPSLQPNEDDKTVDISFFSELGDQVYLNKITIRGNTKTRDKIIRRKIVLEEGDLLTQNKMNLSKRNVASLGYFDPRDGVNWKIKRLSKEEADLDLMVKETKTGHFGAQLGFGGAGVDLRSPTSGFSLKGELADTNLFGSGVHLNMSTMYSKDEQTAILHIAQPWMFDKPILGAFDLYHKRPIYDEFQHVRTVHEKLTGASLTAGFITQSQKEIMHDVNVLILGGVEDIKYTTQPVALNENPLERFEFQNILNKEFAPGTFGYITAKLEQDTRNHPIHTMWGHRWKASTRFAIPSFNSNIGFCKFELDASWYTSLIAEYDLVLRLHGYFGLSTPFKNRTIPFGDLFHIGGQNSVRGFLYGQIGPQFAGDTIGGSKAFFINAELVVPITSDMNMKAVAFYDGGTGFDNPYVNNASKPFVTGNKFDYRHAVGLGIRLLQPMPINIDWGFKIDPRRDRRNPKLNESASEVHFGMSYDW